MNASATFKNNFNQFVTLVEFAKFGAEFDEIINSKINGILNHEIRNQTLNTFQVDSVSSSCQNCNMTLEGLEEPEEEGSVFAQIF